MESQSGQPSWALIARYYAGETTPAEAARVQAWLNRNDDIDVEAALQRVHQRMDAPISLAAHRRRPFFTPMRALAAAAAIAAIALVGVLRERDVADTPTLAAAQVVRTGLGQRDSISLADGTRIIVAPGSRLEIAAGYGATDRRIKLDGEALFSVVHDEAKPFTIETSGALIRDLGTVFTVRSQDDDVVVAVAEGTVELRSSRTPDVAVLLQPGDRGVVRGGRAAEVERGVVPADDDDAFARGALVFRDAPISEVQATLERWYGIELEIDHPALSTRHITATFDREPIQEIVKVIALALGARVEQRDTVYLLKVEPAGVR